MKAPCNINLVCPTDLCMTLAPSPCGNVNRGFTLAAGKFPSQQTLRRNVLWEMEGWTERRGGELKGGITTAIVVTWSGG